MATRRIEFTDGTVVTITGQDVATVRSYFDDILDALTEDTDDLEVESHSYSTDELDRIFNLDSPLIPWNDIK